LLSADAHKTALLSADAHKTPLLSADAHKTALLSRNLLRLAYAGACKATPTYARARSHSLSLSLSLSLTHTQTHRFIYVPPAALQRLRPLVRHGSGFRDLQATANTENSRSKHLHTGPQTRDARPSARHIKLIKLKPAMSARARLPHARPRPYTLNV